MTRQPQFLFPAGSRFGQDNLVLHATGRRHVVNEFAGPLSIKTVMRGEVHWIVEGRRLLVDAHTFLVLGDGQRYSMNINSTKPVETCCVFFRGGFVEQIAQDATTTLAASLDSPWRDAPQLAFLSRLHSDSNRSLLPKIWSLAERCSSELQPSSFEEDFLRLSQNFLMLYREVKAEFMRVPAAKTSTRRELFRRLQIAREYLHENVDRRISLEEVSREACLSRYHLHRAFRRVFRLTPHAYVTGLRLNRARSLLQGGRAVTDVAMDIGFTSVSAFTRLFRSRFGLLPSAVSKIRKIGQA
jgi:AraC family transcriptional regulator